MNNIKSEIAKLIKAHTLDLSEEEIYQMIETPQDSSLGDYAFPCFKLAKALHKAPPMIASDITAAIKDEKIFADVKQVNAYVNMYIDKAYFTSLTLNEVVNTKDAYGRLTIGEGKTAIVEYSSPNIAKPFHIGHIRSTVIGNSLYKIYDALGYKVIRMNHLGDYGTQFGKMITAYRHWGNEDDVKREPIKTLLSYYVKFHEEAEKDASLEEEARETFYKLEHGAEEETKLWQWFREESLKEFKRVYDMLGIDFDYWLGEAFYSDKMQAVLDELKEKNLLTVSQGAQIVDLSQFNLEPALITKSDGTSLYITRDLASALYRKKTFNFDKSIYVVASQQNLHFQQLFNVLKLMGYDWADNCHHVPFGLVSLEDGTMSTRKGKVVFLEDVLNKAVEKTRTIVAEKGVNEELIDETAKTVGIGAVVFNELSAGRIKDYVFNWDKVLNFDGETGPYVQYTHARAASVMRKANVTPDNIKTDNIDYSKLSSDSAYELVKLIYAFPEAIKEAGDKFEPSVITRHIIDVAQAFNKFYHDEQIVVDDEAERNAKLCLTFAAKQTIKNGLDLLGIKAPERM